MSASSVDEYIANLNAVNDAGIPPWAILLINSVKEVLCQLKNINGMMEKFELLEADVAITKNASDKLVVENDRLKDELLKLKGRVDDNEQRNRNLCLLFHGVPESPNEVTDDHVLNVIENDLNINISINDIERSHRLGTKQSQRILRSTHEYVRPIICRFSSFRKRKEVFGNKKKLKGKTISISENLTKTRYGIYQEAIKRIGMGKVWTMEGRIMTKDGERFTIINTLEDINDLIP